MRVLWICNLMLPAVAEKLGREVGNKEGWVAGLADTVLCRQQENGIELAVAFPVPDGLEAEACRGEIAIGGGKLFWYGFPENVRRAHLYEKSLEAGIRDITEDFGPDVVHCFGTEFAHTLAALQSGFDRSRILVGLQGICSVIAQNYMAGLPLSVQKKVTLRDFLKQDSIRQQQQKYVLRGEREKEILRLAENVTGRTEFDRVYTLQLNPRIRYFFMNETLRPCFYEGEWSRETCVPHRIFVSQADYPLKGFHHLLSALPALSERYPDLEVHVAGDNIIKYGTWKEKLKISAYGSYLRQLIAEPGLEKRVTFLGKLNAQEMKEEILHCGLFLCCSSNENSPNSLGEAMLLGAPCAATDTGGIPSVFERDRDGILFELQAQAVAEAVCRIWDDPERTKMYCANAKQHARGTHDKEQNYRRLMQIYSEITGAQ